MSSSVLELTIKGKILDPSDPDFENARKIWNGMIDKKPALIAQCLDADDIAACVKFAKKNQMIVSVRGGGHNVAGNAICDGGLMIDLSLMKEIKVDTTNKTATAEPGVRLKEFDEATQAHGLVTTGGTVSHTGLAGLTLGGGIGWLMSKFGTTCDNLLSAELVTADSEKILVDQDNYPDLFWAIRGGGGNFGIVSKFKYQLHTFGPNVVAGMILYPMDQAKSVFQFYREYTRKAPDDLMVNAGCIVTPDGLPVTMLFPAWLGDIKEADKYLAPIRSFGTPLADMVAEIPYLQLQTALDAAAPSGIRRYWKSGYFTELSDDLLDIVLKNIASRVSPLSPFLLFHIRGKVARIAPDATAFGHRDDHWDADIISQWLDPSEDEKNITWTRNFWNDIKPFTKGVYVNHLGGEEENARVKDAYGENYEKLSAIKKKYDPENFFRMNNNIKPA